MEDIKVIIAKNIVAYRTSLGITQIELAEKLNYSDKSVSKWERALGVPDILVLKEMAELFCVKVDDLITPHENSDKIVLPDKRSKRAKRLLITLMSTGLVWLVATIVYVILGLIGLEGIWRVFVYALPATMVVFTVFSALWGNRVYLTVSVSLLIWTVIASIYITFIGTKAWLFFFIGIPLQILAILGMVLLKVADKRKLNK